MSTRYFLLVRFLSSVSDCATDKWKPEFSWRPSASLLSPQRSPCGHLSAAVAEAGCPRERKEAPATNTSLKRPERPQSRSETAVKTAINDRRPPKRPSTKKDPVEAVSAVAQRKTTPASQSNFAEKLRFPELVRGKIFGCDISNLTYTNAGATNINLNPAF